MIGRRTLLGAARGVASAVGLGLIVSCGARTGLTVPERDAAASRDSGPGVDASAEPAEVDFLYVMDPSITLSDSREVLRREVIRVVDDLDGSSSVRLAVVSTDLGSGGFAVVGCPEPSHGDDALLVRSSTCGWGTRAYVRDDEVDRVGAALGCLVDSRPVTCGFEQPLEAMLRALSPVRPTDWTSSEYLAPELLHDAPLHGDAANAGFLRRDSVLVIFYVSEEDDCSALDATLFDPASGTYGSVSLNSRCAFFADTALVPVEDRYPRALLQLRRDPRRLVMVMVTGIPPDRIPPDGAGDWDSLIEYLDDLPPGSLLCAGSSAPAPRLTRLAAALADAGAQVVVESFCRLGELRSLSARVRGAVRIAAMARDADE